MTVFTEEEKERILQAALEYGEARAGDHGRDPVAVAANVLCNVAARSHTAALARDAESARVAKLARDEARIAELVRLLPVLDWLSLDNEWEPRVNEYAEELESLLRQGLPRWRKE